VSTDYTALFKTAPDVVVETVDCIRISTLKEDLEDEDGKFVDDELSIEIDSPSCRTAAEQAALAVLLGAVDPLTPCYVLVEIAEGGSSTYAQVFRGAVRTDVQATDLRWYGPEYGDAPTPERSYKFAAKSYSVAVMERDLATLIPDTPTDTLHPYYTAWSTFVSTKVKHWLAAAGWYNFSWESDTYAFCATYFSWLVDINDALRYLADRIEEEVGDPSFSILFAESPIGMTFGTPELQYAVPTGLESLFLGDLAPDISHRTTNSVSDAKLGDGELGPLVKITMFQPQTDTNKPFSFRRSKTLAQLCYDLARPLGLFASFKYDNSGNLVIRFLSREQIYKDEGGSTKYTFIRDVDSGSIKSQPTTVSAEKERYYGYINQFAVEGRDVFAKVRGGGYTQSDLKKATGSKDNMLAVTIGATLMDTYEDTFRANYRKLWGAGWYYRTVPEVGLVDPPANAPLSHINFIDPDYPDLTTALFVRTTNEKLYEFSSGSFIDTGRRYDSVRPVTQVDVTIDGAQESFTELGEYVNRLKALDGQYFESEYELQVPYVSAFRRTPSGADSYFNIDLGSTVTIDDTDYVVVGLERDFDALTTKVRLHALTRFSVFARPETVAAADIDAGALDPEVPEGRRANVEQFIAGENITAGWAVSVDALGRAIKAKPVSGQYNKVVGVALESKATGESVSVCTSGVCTVPDTYTIGQALWLRHGSPNMSSSRITSGTTTEHVDQKIGTCLGAGVIEVNIGRPFVWYGYGFGA